MLKFKKYIFVAAVLSVSSAAVSYSQTPEHRQEVMELLREDPTRSVNLHHNYEAPEKIVDTPAPKGYKPFYVSHYGRHGSRYHYTERYMKEPLSVFDSLDAHGLLTEEGKSVKKDLEILLAAHDGQLGYLTHKGAAQHQQIAERLYGRCPEIFSQKDRREVYCVATDVQRCIQSMANFCVGLTRGNQSLDITMDAGPRFTKYLCNADGVPRTTQRETFVADSVLNANLETSRLLAKWTVDPEAAMKYMPKGDARKFMTAIFWGGSTGQCLDIQDPNIYRHFTPEELYALWAYYDVKYFDIMSATVENSRNRDIIAKRNVQDILDKADAAVAGNHRAADLRFGHDTGLSPIFSFLRVEGLEKERHMADAIDGVWYGFRDMPMASNLQLIFYRNKKGDVLVKLLRNEKETLIPALKPVSGPYYSWKDMRAYFVSLLSE